MRSKSMYFITTIETKKGKGDVLVFDEIDIGISGKAANSVAKKLKTKMNEIIASDERIYDLNVEKGEAISYYKKVKCDEKAENIHNLTNKIVTVHKLRNYINYFFHQHHFLN